MEDLNDKITGGVVTATEWNQIPSELQNVIEVFQTALSSGNLDQLGEAIASYVAAGNFYVDTGSANTYVVGPISGKQGLVILSVDTDGALIRFIATNNNTGASTLNVNGLGVKSIVDSDGNALINGDITTDRDTVCRWDETADNWILVRQLTSDTSQSTTTGTTKLFSSIPAWVKRITIVFDEVSLNGTDNIEIVIGDAGGLELTSYVSSSEDAAGAVNSTIAYILKMATAGQSFAGTMVLHNISGNVWVASHVGKRGTGITCYGGGTKTLTAKLTQLQMQATGANSFDLGDINIMYE